MARCTFAVRGGWCTRWLTWFAGEKNRELKRHCTTSCSGISCCCDDGWRVFSARAKPEALKYNERAVQFLFLQTRPRPTFSLDISRRRLRASNIALLIDI